MALLDLVNDLRDLLREERASTVSGAGPDLRVQVELVNRAARKVLARRAWSFLHREDGYLFFPARMIVTAFSLSQNLNREQQIVIGLASVLKIADGNLLVKMTVPSDPIFQDISYVVTNIAPSLDEAVFTLATIYRGQAGSRSVTVYANEAALPVTVARVLSIRNEEGTPIRFETIDTFDDFERRFPHDAERFADRPEVIAVGGQIVPTSRTGGSPNTPVPGLGVRIFPPPDADVLLRYSYVRRVADLASDDDDLTGVPREVQDHIIRVAFEEALMGNIEDDPRRAQTLRVQNELDYRELVGADRRDVGRRMVPRPFGTGVRVPYSELVSETIPEP